MERGGKSASNSPPFPSLIYELPWIQAAVKFWALGSGLSKMNLGESLQQLQRFPENWNVVHSGKTLAQENMNQRLIHKYFWHPFSRQEAKSTLSHWISLLCFWGWTCSRTWRARQPTGHKLVHCPFLSIFLSQCETW